MNNTTEHLVKSTCEIETLNQGYILTDMTIRLIGAFGTTLHLLAIAKFHQLQTAHNFLFLSDFISQIIQMLTSVVICIICIATNYWETILVCNISNFD